MSYGAARAHSIGDVRFQCTKYGKKCLLYKIIKATATYIAQNLFICNFDSSKCRFLTI